MSCLVVLRGEWRSCVAERIAERHNGMISPRADICGSAAHSLRISNDPEQFRPHLRTAWPAQGMAANLLPKPPGRLENTFSTTFREYLFRELLGSITSTASTLELDGAKDVGARSLRVRSEIDNQRPRV